MLLCLFIFLIACITQKEIAAPDYTRFTDVIRLNAGLQEKSSVFSISTVKYSSTILELT